MEKIIKENIWTETQAGIFSGTKKMYLVRDQLLNI